MASVVNALGDLGRLAAELRQEIFALAISSDKDCVRLHSACGPYVALLRVSKQIRHESQPLISKALEQECSHKRFAHPLPPSYELGDTHILSRRTNYVRRPRYDHNIYGPNVVVLSTRALPGRDRPSAVLVTLKYPSGSTCTIYGGSQRCEESLVPAINQVLRQLEQDFATGPYVANLRWCSGRAVERLMRDVRKVVEGEHWEG